MPVARKELEEKIERYKSKEQLEVEELQKKIFSKLKKSPELAFSVQELQKDLKVKNKGHFWKAIAVLEDEKKIVSYVDPEERKTYYALKESG